MPDRRQHRGAHPGDENLFAREVIPVLNQAVFDLSFLLSRSYSFDSALKVVGDRYQLQKRQRTAVARAACSDAAAKRRRAALITDCTSRIGLLDGYNILTTIEAALAKGIILLCRDGAIRDLASMHGTWKRVTETDEALQILGGIVDSLHLSGCRCYLDKPVSNSGRLAGLIRQAAAGWSTPWEVILAEDADRELIREEGVVFTSDSQVLNRCRSWFNIAEVAIREHARGTWIIDVAGNIIK